MRRRHADARRRRRAQAYKPVRAIALEEAFLRGDDTVESLPGTGGSKYTVDLSTMVQRNKSTKRARSVRRIAALGHGGQAKSEGAPAAASDS